VAYLLSHWISFDPFHIVMQPLRLSFLVLLLLPLPYPNLPAIWEAIRRKTKRQRAAAAAPSSSNSSSSAAPSSSSSSSSSLAEAAQSSSSSSSTASLSEFVSWYQPRHYWEYPRVRYCIIIMQRVLPLVAAACCVGPSYNSYFEFTLGVLCWRMLRKCVYDGWMQYMLVVSDRQASVMVCYVVVTGVFVCGIAHDSTHGGTACGVIA
jgi:hypothetical protein